MLDVQLLRSDLDAIVKRLSTRGMTFDAEAFSALEDSRKQVQTRTQELQAKRNSASKQIGELKRKGEDASALIKQMGQVGEELKQLEVQLGDIQSRLDHFLLGIPNLPHESVPLGRSPDDNVEVRRVGDPGRLAFRAKDHVDIGTGLGMMDFERAAKISGARFTLITGPLARLHRAIAQFMLDVHTREHGYTEVYAPYLVNADSMRGTGQLPKFEGDSFAVNAQSVYMRDELLQATELEKTPGSMATKRQNKFYLIPTAEVPITNIVRDEIVALDK
ncbi:MAG: serine--tRNA ligase, partial [Burkholderiales bacterium]